MKSLALLSLVLLFGSRAGADSVLQPNDSLGIIGDSITAQHLYSATSLRRML